MADIVFGPIGEGKSMPFSFLDKETAALRESIKAELKASWEPELKQARIEAERKKGRELAKHADQNRNRGRVYALCDVAVYFISKDRLDIARHILDHFMIDREKAATAFNADKRTTSMTLEYLDRAGAWGKPPQSMEAV